MGQVAAVARRGEHAAIDCAARGRMAAAHALAQRVFESGVPTYGLTTGYGAQKRVAVAPEDVSRFNRSQIQDHRAGQGPPATDDVVRAAMLCLANLFAGGTTVVRPELADALIEALNTDRHPIVRLHGSIGVSDLSAMADLAHGVIGEMDLRAGEGLALLNNSAFGTATAALALHDANACSTPRTSPARWRWRASAPTSPFCTPAWRMRARTRASRPPSSAPGRCSPAATCGRTAPRGTCRTR